MELAHYCMDNPAHIFKGNNLDGIRCPYCDGLVNIKPVSKEEYEKLPKYRELKKKFKSTNKQCSDLADNQIKLIEGLIHRNQKYNMPICSCDITRVLDIGSELLNKSR